MYFLSNSQPAYIIYQNELVTAFLDINPVTKGHTLVCPNKHIKKLDEITDTYISNALMEALICLKNAS